jgi:hypothetical protein
MPWEDRLIRSPILKALSSIRKSGVRTLLMGGQACVVYGATEFSRDLDLLVLISPDNPACLRDALDELLARPIAVPVTQPPLSPELLMHGHAFHFRCHRPDAGVRTLQVSGCTFLIDAFHGNAELADSVNRLLVVGFCTSSTSTFLTGSENAPKPIRACPFPADAHVTVTKS